MEVHRQVSRQLQSGGHMVLPDDLLRQGFLLQDAEIDDLNTYIKIKKDCCKKYVDQYYGGWDNRIQTVISKDSFHRLLEITCFCKILQYENTIGFFSYKEQQDQISEVSLHVLPSFSDKGIKEFFLGHLVSRSQETHKPVYITVYQSDPWKSLLVDAGFQVYDKSRSHYLMSYNKQHRKGINDYRNRIYSKSSEENMDFKQD
jgi:hypothetical protein